MNAGVGLRTQKREGQKQCGYLPKHVKKQVDKIVEKMARELPDTQYALDKLLLADDVKSTLRSIDPVKRGHQFEPFRVMLLEWFADEILFYSDLERRSVIAQRTAAVKNQSHAEPFQRLRIVEPEQICVGNIQCLQGLPNPTSPVAKTVKGDTRRNWADDPYQVHLASAGNRQYHGPVKFYPEFSGQVLSSYPSTWEAMTATSESEVADYGKAQAIQGRYSAQVR